MKTEKFARRIINQAYNGHLNVMTPSIYEYGWVNDTMAYEISHGTGIFSQYMVGVTLVSLDEHLNSIKEYDLSSCFSGDDLGDTVEEAKNYIKELQ